MGHVVVDQDGNVYEDQEVQGGTEMHSKEKEGSHFGLCQEKCKYVMDYINLNLFFVIAPVLTLSVNEYPFL